MYGFSGTSKEREHVISEVMTSKDKKKKTLLLLKEFQTRSNSDLAWNLQQQYDKWKHTSNEQPSRALHKVLL